MTEKRATCWNCGEDMGPWTKYSDRSDSWGAPACERVARWEAVGEREAAHEQLDRDMGYGW